ncbi:LysR family transcriptional regulator [Luteolibacter pohnpeiensis]|uniref:LysR family transcriptional regulator n=1 Tax=Luteolibacter pohnpeiensis TaxID=454153 RepID=A0A934S963_9BACT|nr:LysR family transcriptional regulator [Luteolibacter pohnpeiensis]MBK1881118.1 LysR family transcriptional regulator [Luteolibacter pohnpeiensis]
MEIRELKSFVVLAEQLHFGRAANLLNLSQPALTKQIRKLEDELGGELFERGKHRTVLSATGMQFLPEVRAMLLGFDRLLQRGSMVARGEVGQLRLGFGFHTFELVPKLIVRLREIAPGIEVSLRDMSTAEQVSALEARELDLGFLRAPVPASLQSIAAVKDRMAFISSSASPLPEKATLADCRDQPFVTISEDRSPAFHRHTLQLCARHGFHPKIVQSVPEFMTAVALVQAGLGVAMIPQSFWNHRIEGVRFHRLREKNAAWSVAAAWNKADRNPALLAFLKLLKADLRS